MGPEEVFVKGIPLSDPIRSAGEGEVGVPEQARHPDPSDEMSWWKEASRDQDRSRDHLPERHASKGSISGDVLLESLDGWCAVLHGFSNREHVPCEE